MKRLEGQVALVTGASKGIGKAIAQALAAEGANVVLAARSTAEIERLAGELSRSGVGTMAVPTDVTRDEDVELLVSKAVGKFGRIDILVNNAGAGTFKRFVDLEMDEFDAMWRLNVRAPFFTTKLVLPHMMSRHSGAIVNIASLAGKTAL